MHLFQRIPIDEKYRQLFVRLFVISLLTFRYFSTIVSRFGAGSAQFLTAPAPAPHPWQAPFTVTSPRLPIPRQRIPRLLTAAQCDVTVTSLMRPYCPNLLCKVILAMVINASTLVHNGLIGATIVASGVYLHHRRQGSSAIKQLHSRISALKPTPF